MVINGYSCVLGSITIGDNSIIGAGSMVLHDVPMNTVFYNKRVDCYRENG